MNKCFYVLQTSTKGVKWCKSDLAHAVSGVAKGTVFIPLLLSLYINDISADIVSEIRLFADDRLLP